MKLEQLLKTGRNILLSSIFALGMNSAVNGQAASGFGTVFDTNEIGMVFANVQYVMAEDESRIYNFNADDMGIYDFENIDLITTVVDKPSLEELTTYIGTGQDHNFNIQTKEQPSVATVYNLLGQPITTVNPTWDGEVAHYYWDGSVNGQELSVGSYIFTTAVNGEQFTQKVMQLNNGSFIGDSYKTEEKNLMNTKSTQTVEKKVYVHLWPSEEGFQFLPTTDTIWLHEGDNYFIEHFVEPIPATIDQYFKLVDSNTREGLEHFTIRAKDTDASGAILGETQTDANGIALLQNIPEDALLYLEYGPEFANGADTSYYSSKGNKWQMLPDTWFANDTISPDTVKLALPNKNLIIPQTENDPAPATIWTPASYVKEMIRGPPAPHNGIGEPVNIEQAYRNEIRIWLNENTATWVPNYLTQIDSLFYADGTFPYVVVEDSIDTDWISSTINYHHETNYYPGELGFNVRHNGSYTYLKKKTAYDEFSLNNNNTDYMNIILGGNIWVTNGPQVVFKECVMRLNNFNDVTSRPSFANPTATVPNEYDRAITRAIRINQFNRVSSTDERVQSYSLYYLTDSFND